MANISLEGSIRTCKVDTAFANKIQSDRFMNPNNMLCPVWNGVDTTGRSVCVDSYRTKQGGCNSAMDRLLVENELRPQYMEYITLDASGIRGGQNCPQNKMNADAKCARNKLNNVHLHTGQFGYQTGYSQNIHPNCLSCPNSTVNGGSNVVEQYIAMKQKQQMARGNLLDRIML